MSIKYKGKTVSGGGAGTSFTTDDTLTMNEDGVLGVTTPVKGITQAEYDALTEEQQKSGLYVITDAEGGSGGGTSEDVYSYEETRIGTWVDGKPLYRRVVQTTTPPGASGDSVVYSAEQFTYIDTLVNIYGIFVFSANNFNYKMPANMYSSGNLATSLYLMNGWITMYASSGNYQNKPINVILKYTKTTD